MKTALILILCVIGYLFMGMVIWGIGCLVDRLNGESEYSVYNDAISFSMCFLLWPYVLICLIILVLLRLFDMCLSAVFEITITARKWMISVIEIIVAKTGGK